MISHGFLWGVNCDDWTTGKTATCAGLAFAWRFGVFGYRVLVKFLGERASWISLPYLLQISGHLPLSLQHKRVYIYPVDYTATGHEPLNIEHVGQKRKDIRSKGPRLHTALSLTVQIPDNINSYDTLKIRFRRLSKVKPQQLFTQGRASASHGV